MCKVETTHRDKKNEKRKVKSITKNPAKSAMFEDRDGKSQSVLDYWKTTKYKPLAYPFLPCLDVSKGKRVNYLPPEVCR